MFVHIEERRIWLRAGTHTALRDVDPEFARFAESQRGQIQRILRVWLAEPRQMKPYLRTYLGMVSCLADGPAHRELRRLFRLASRAAASSGQPARQVRRLLTQALREHIRRSAAA